MVYPCDSQVGGEVYAIYENSPRIALKNMFSIADIEINFDIDMYLYCVIVLF